MPPEPDWWLYGNQQPIESSVSSFVRSNEQFAPNPGTAPFANAGASRFETGLSLFVNKDGPGSAGLRAARVTGPGLPPHGIVLARPTPEVPGQNWLSIRRKDGLTDPGATTAAADQGSVFRRQRTQGLNGAEATTLRPNPNASNSNNTAFPGWAHPVDYGASPGASDYIDFSRLGTGSAYQFEVFYDGEAAPRHTLTKRTLGPVIPATRAASLQWVSLTPATLKYLDPADPLAAAQPSMDLVWTANPLAETIRSAEVSTFGGSQSTGSGSVPVAPRETSVVAEPSGTSFQALTHDGTSSRSILLRYRTPDVSKSSVWRFN